MRRMLYCKNCNLWFGYGEIPSDYKCPHCREETVSENEGEEYIRETKLEG